MTSQERRMRWFIFSLLIFGFLAVSLILTPSSSLVAEEPDPPPIPPGGSNCRIVGVGDTVEVGPSGPSVNKNGGVPEWPRGEEILLFDEGAMELNSIRVPSSGVEKDNFEVNYSNGQVIFKLPIG